MVRDQSKNEKDVKIGGKFEGEDEVKMLSSLLYFFFEFLFGCFFFEVCFSVTTVLYPWVGL